MVLLVPGNEARDPLGDRRRRLETDIAHEVVNIGEGGRNVAGLHRQQLTNGLFSDRLFQNFHNLTNIDRTFVADIVNAPWR